MTIKVVCDRIASFYKKGVSDMSRRTVGILFCCIAAFLYGTRYLCAAIFGQGVSSWNSDLFRAMLEYVGGNFVTLSIISLIIGILYLAWAEMSGK